MNLLKNKAYFWWIFTAILIIACVVRVYNIDYRPLHNDEGVNYFFFDNIRRDGYYKYSHENYHGPSYFYLSTFMTGASMLGTSEFGMRSSAIFIGLLSILLVLLLRCYVGNIFTLFAAGCLAIASSLVFYSRYAIHETLLCFAGAWLAFSMYAWWRDGKLRHVYQMGLALALLITTKETFIISLFTIFWAFVSLGHYKLIWQRLRVQWQHFLWSSLVMSVIVVFTFSGGLQWMGGVREMFLAVPQWVGRNTSDVGHFKSYWYYCVMLFGSELMDLFNELFSLELGTKMHLTKSTRSEIHLLFVFLIPLIELAVLQVWKWCRCGRVRCAIYAENLKKTYFRPNFFRFCLVWSVLAFLVYSYVDYKTPWLVINITFPFNLALACILSHVVKQYGKVFGTGICSLVLALSLFNMWKYNFKVGFEYGRENPYSYTHTSQGMLDVVGMIDTYRKTHPDLRVLVGVKSYWPLPYYLRNFGVLGYEHTQNPDNRKNNYDVLIVDNWIRWSNSDWVSEYRRLSDVQETNVYFKVRN